MTNKNIFFICFFIAIINIAIGINIFYKHLVPHTNYNKNINYSLQLNHKLAAAEAEITIVTNENKKLYTEIELLKKQIKAKSKELDLVLST